MACKCGSQIVLCNLPIRFDTYVGCSHGCRYCFVQKKNGQLEAVKKGDTVESLKAFVQGKRSGETAWCDWNIPIHWGGMSDPFQPVEKKYGYSLERLKYLAETKYPFVVSTKGRLAASLEYLELLAECNCVVQISMVCSRYDQLEKGAPSYEERLEMLRTISPRVKRTIVRIQPFMHEVLQDVLKNLPRVKAAGAHGVVVEGMKFAKAKPGLVRVGGGCLGWHHAPPKLRSEDNAVVRKKRPRPWKHAVLDCGSSAPEHPGRRQTIAAASDEMRGGNAENERRGTALGATARRN
mgnify:CR=1 FL=1